MTTRNIKNAVLSTMVGALIVSSALAVPVNDVAGLQNAIRGASAGSEIFIAAGTYDLSTEPCMSRAGHLYATVRIALRGATGNPEDVVLVGTTNRILYLAASGNTISGLTFKGGKSTSNPKVTSGAEPYDQHDGGAILLRADKDESTITNCVFVGNQARFGGAIANYYAASTSKLRYGGNVIDCTFTNNVATTIGGAAFNVGLIRNCTFEDNQCVQNGGAVYQVHHMSECTFAGNRTTGTSDGCGGGALYQAGTVLGDNLTVRNCSFSGNESATVGGACFNVHDIAGCSFARNEAVSGGAVYDCDVKSSAFSGNTATSQGGAAYNCLLVCCTNGANTCGSAYGSELRDCNAVRCVFNSVGKKDASAFYSCTFDSCRILSAENCNLFGAGVCMTNSLISGCGRKCYLFHGCTKRTELINCTIVANDFADIKYGGTVACVADFVNCYFYGNRMYSGDYDFNGSHVDDVVRSANCCILSKSDEVDVSGEDNLYYSVATFNPGFVGATKNPEDPYALRLTSPAHSKHGLTSDWMASATDIRGDGYARLRDGFVDIGCYQCWIDPIGFVVRVR